MFTVHFKLDNVYVKLWNWLLLIICIFFWSTELNSFKISIRAVGSISNLFIQANEIDLVFNLVINKWLINFKDNSPFMDLSSNQEQTNYWNLKGRLLFLQHSLTFNFILHIFLNNLNNTKCFDTFLQHNRLHRHISMQMPQWNLNTYKNQAFSILCILSSQNKLNHYNHTKISLRLSSFANYCFQFAIRSCVIALWNWNLSEK